MKDLESCQSYRTDLEHLQELISGDRGNIARDYRWNSTHPVKRPALSKSLQGIIDVLYDHGMLDSHDLSGSDFVDRSHIIHREVKGSE